jgi:hypothetical protein
VIRFRTAFLPLIAVLLALGVVFGIRQLWSPPRIVEQDVRDLVHSTIQRESAASFLVTGFLEVVTTATVENTQVLLPGMLDLSLGTTRATVRVPGRVSYGFEAASLRPEMIEVDGTTIEITQPSLAIYSAEPTLSELEVQTQIGWARLPATGPAAERRAIGHLTDALRMQGAAHLRDSVQPRVNTARALEAMLTPVLQAAGIAAPRFRFRIGDGIVVEGQVADSVVPE